MPGFLIATAYLLQSLYQLEKWPKWTQKIALEKRVTITAIATISVLSPILITFPFTKSVSYGEGNAVAAMCTGMPQRSMILWLGIAGKELVMPTRVFCHDVKALSHTPSGRRINKSVPDTKSLREFARIAISENRTPLVGFYGYENEFFDYSYNEFTLVSTQNYSNLEHVLNMFPRKTTDTNIDVYVGQITKEGGIRPLLEK